jgi:hypothetical protein
MLFKMARDARNEGWFNSMENVGSSSAVVAHLSKDGRPAVTFEGVSMVKPKAKGRTAARMQSFANILRVVREEKKRASRIWRMGLRFALDNKEPS